MDPVLFLVAVLVVTIALGPIFGAESRKGVPRPDRKTRPAVGSMRREDWDRLW